MLTPLPNKMEHFCYSSFISDCYRIIDWTIIIILCTSTVACSYWKYCCKYSKRVNNYSAPHKKSQKITFFRTFFSAINATFTVSSGAGLIRKWQPLTFKFMQLFHIKISPKFRKLIKHMTYSAYCYVVNFWKFENFYFLFYFLPYISITPAPVNGCRAVPDRSRWDLQDGVIY